MWNCFVSIFSKTEHKWRFNSVFQQLVWLLQHLICSQESQRKELRYVRRYEILWALYELPKCFILYVSTRSSYTGLLLRRVRDRHNHFDNVARKRSVINGRIWCFRRRFKKIHWTLQRLWRSQELYVPETWRGHMVLWGVQIERSGTLSYENGNISS